MVSSVLQDLQLVFLTMAWGMAHFPMQAMHAFCFCYVTSLTEEEKKRKTFAIRRHDGTPDTHAAMVHRDQEKNQALACKCPSYTSCYRLHKLQEGILSAGRLTSSLQPHCSLTMPPCMGCRAKTVRRVWGDLSCSGVVCLLTVLEGSVS